MVPAGKECNYWFDLRVGVRQACAQTPAGFKRLGKEMFRRATDENPQEGEL